MSIRARWHLPIPEFGRKILTPIPTAMIEGTDYSVSGELDLPGRTVRTIDLLSPTTDQGRLYIRQRFSPTP